MIAITVARFLITGTAQEFQHTDTIKKHYRCFVSIETMNGEKIEAALSDLRADSIRLAPVDSKSVRAGGKFIKILQEDSETTLAVDQLKTFKIKYDSNIIYPDELVKRKKQLRQNNAGKIVGITVATALTVALVPISMVSGGGIDPSLPFSFLVTADGPNIVSVPGNNLSITKSYKTFTIKGDNDKYLKMVKRLTKSKTNPFENSVAKK